jgi:NitT/TauT family transport system permease protein
VRLWIPAIRALAVLVFFACWELLPRLGLVNPALLPTFSEVVSTLWGLLSRPKVQESIFITGAEVLLAFAVAIPLGTLLGVIIAENQYIGAIFRPILFYVFSIPKSIFLPMFILVFGISFTQKVAYAAFTTTFVVLMSAAACVESVKEEFLLVARSYGATRMQMLVRVYLPSMLPMLLEAIRIAMIFNFTGVMIAEMYASRTGIGHLIAGWGENFQMPQLFAGILLLSIIAILFNESIRILEERFSTWRTT